MVDKRAYRAFMVIGIAMAKTFIGTESGDRRNVTR